VLVESTIDANRIDQPAIFKTHLGEVTCVDAIARQKKKRNKKRLDYSGWI
jgi:hypothetical protein